MDLFNGNFAIQHLKNTLKVVNS
uniref:Uncharacterized protein n=1 Tax=Arundo donax TaxID=35708 RepID=A0A0A9AK39_ARUDO